jgi:hypothetical protein
LLQSIQRFFKFLPVKQQHAFLEQSNGRVTETYRAKTSTDKTYKNCTSSNPQLRRLSKVGWPRRV